MKKTCLFALLCVAVLLLVACVKETASLETDVEKQLEENVPTEALPASETTMPETEVFESPPISVTILDWEELETFWNSTNLDEEAYEAYADTAFYRHYSQNDITKIKEELSGMPFPYAEDYECLGMRIIPEYEKMVVKYRAADVCTFSYYFGRSFDEEKYLADSEKYTPVQLLSTEVVQSCYMVGEEDSTIDGYVRSCYVLNVGGSKVNLIIIGQPKEQAANTIANFRFGNVEEILAERQANPIDQTLTFASHAEYWDFLQCVFMDTLDMSRYLHENGYIEKGIGGQKDVMRVSKIVQDLPIPVTEKMEISSLTIDPVAETVEVLLTAGEDSVLCRLGGGVQALSEGEAIQPRFQTVTQIQSLRDRTDADQRAAGERAYSLMVEDQPMELITTGMTQEELVTVLDTFTFFGLNDSPE